MCRARVVTARDAKGIERILRSTYEHNHTRKYPERKVKKEYNHLLISKVCSLNNKLNSS